MSGRRYNTQQAAELPDPVTFELDGTEYTCRELTALELSQVARMHGQDASSPESLAFMAEFFEMLLGHDQYRAFLAHTSRFATGIEILVDIVQGVFEDLTERPIGRPSDSSPGRPTTEPKSTDGSSSRVPRRLENRPDLAMAVLQAARAEESP